MKQSPAAFFRDTILVHESSRHSLDPRDTGNFVGTRLVGSKYGVTGRALAAHRRVPPSSITTAMMSQLTEAEAVEVGLSGYYRVRGLDQLPWDVVVAGVVDLGFNAGPSAAVKILQRLIGVPDDGTAGPKTREAYLKWRSTRNDAQAMRDWTAARIAFYRRLNNPTYIKGWTNRSNSFLPGTPWWTANVG